MYTVHDNEALDGSSSQRMRPSQWPQATKHTHNPRVSLQTPCDLYTTANPDRGLQIARFRARATTFWFSFSRARGYVLRHQSYN